MTQTYASALLAVLEQPGEIRTALVAPVNGETRLVADIAERGCDERDQASLVRKGALALQDMTGWRMLTPEGKLDNQVVAGVALARVSHRRIAALAISGAETDLGTLRARLAEVEAINVSVEVGLQSRSSSAHNPLQQAAQRLQGVQAQAVFVDCRTTAEARTVAALLRAAGVRDAVGYVRLLYAGPSEIAGTLQQALGEAFSVEHFSTITWSAKDFRVAELRRAVGRLLDAHPEEVSGGISDIDGVRAMSDPVSRAKTQAVRMLTLATRASTCLVDSTLAELDITVGQAVDSDDDYPAPAPHPGVPSTGTSGLEELLRRPDLSSITRWLPFDVEETKLRDYLGNRLLRPWFVPSDERDLLIEGGVVRALSELTSRANSRYDYLVGTGSIATYPRIGQSVLALLDVAQPVAPCRVLLDRGSVLARLNPLMRLSPEACMSLLRSDALLNLGACLSLSGKAKQGETIGEVSVHRSPGDGAGTSDKQESYEIRFGTITIIRLSARHQASLRVATGRRFSFGIDPDYNSWTVGSAETGLQTPDGIAGGVLGLVIDARGRPIELAHDKTRRQALMSDWLRSLDAYDAELFSTLE